MGLVVRVLGIETATRIGSVGIVDDDKTLAARCLGETASHAVSLLQLVQKALADAGLRVVDVDLFAVSIGPGSFTGLRVGLSVAKGLALAVGRPVVAVPTLEAFAHATGARPGTVWPVLDARKGEVYAAAYRTTTAGLVCARAPMVVRPDVLVESIAPPCVLVGEGADAYADVVRRRWGTAVEFLPHASLPPVGTSVARLGRERFLRAGADLLSEIEPQYIRAPDAALACPTTI